MTAVNGLAGGLQLDEYVSVNTLCRQLEQWDDWTTTEGVVSFDNRACNL